MIHVRDLTKNYGEHLAIDCVSFDAEPGQIIGLLGSNGAGKTTTLRILTCFLPATAGDARVGGYDVFTEASAVRRLIGYMPENAPLPDELRASEYLAYRARLKGVPRANRRAEVQRCAELCRLEPERLRQRIDSLSKGYRQRVGLADALLGDPPVLILDEPTAGLDPRQIIQARQLIKDLGKNHTVLLSTHILPEVEAMCDRVLIMEQGRIALQSSVGDLASQGLVLEVKGRIDMAEALVRGIQGVLKVARREAPKGHSRLAITLRNSDDDADVREAIYHVCVAARLPIMELAAQHNSLEDLFVAATTGAVAEGAEA
jgi:ABC-2 type transport system ATP-binding protein